MSFSGENINVENDNHINTLENDNNLITVENNHPNNDDHLTIKIAKIKEGNQEKGTN